MNRGRAELLLVLRRTTVEFVAARCGVSESAVYNWTAGLRKPRRGARNALQKNYGICVAAWDQASPASPALRSGDDRNTRRRG